MPEARPTFPATCSTFDVLIRGARNQPFIGIAAGRFAGFEDGEAREVIDASGLLALPGVIDAHVHFNEPGRADWEGLATGSRACAAGGTTTFCDMPLNAHPPTIDGPSFDAKRAAAERESMVDFALWGGLVPGNLDALEALRDRGVIGVKAFMATSGIDDFPMVELATLRTGMQRAASLGMLVAVHAELERPALRRGSSVRDYLVSRPIEIELDAIRAALDLAGETGCALHVVHVSSAAGVALVAAARQRGMDVTCETCPHYLTLTEADMETLGAVAKCAPPLREEAARRALLAEVRAGRVTTIGSDHSPAPMTMKTDPDFFNVWGGISGCQHLLPLLLNLDLSPEQIAQLTATNVADRMGLMGRKGRMEIGHDADLVLVDPAAPHPVTAGSLYYRHRHSPYVGRTLRARVVRTFLRGQTVFLDGKIVGSPQGRFLPRTP
jgi:allantoinase